MRDRIFEDRERAVEGAYFHQEDAKLLNALRQKASLDEIALALGRKLQVDNPDLLLRVRATGISPEAAPALFLAPLVQIAWATPSKAKHKAVLRLVHGRGIEMDSPAHRQLLNWLKRRPPNALFETAIDVIRYGFSVLPADEREERIRSLVHACREVAEASRTRLSWIFGSVQLSAVSKRETDTLQMISSELARPGGLGVAGSAP